ncbi:uncharacterized protein TNCV_891381 [Trichonephila clavipes]|nr:uncharacterized protein TNCV_891381 [Trichonephila clavipes]
MENKPLPEEAATSNDQVQNTKSSPVPPSKRPTEEFITDNAAAISESFSNSEGLTQPALARSPLFHPPETSTATSKRKKAAAPTENNTSDKTSNVPKSLVKRETRKRATVDEDGFRLPPKKQTANPNGKHFLSSPAAILTHPNSSAPSAPPIILSNAYEAVEEIEFDTERASGCGCRFWG